jgi:sugar phosphate isomerase/epimerase
MLKNRVKIGYTVDYFQGFTPAVIITGLHILGVKFIELTKSALDQPEEVAETLRGMQTAIHLPLICKDGWDLSCPDHSEKIDAYIDNVNNNREKLRIQHAVVHPPEPESAPEPVATSIEFWIQNLKRLHLPVFVENIPHQSPEKFDSLFTTVQQVLKGQLAGMCFDAPHYWVTGHDPVALYTKWHHRIGAVHLSDCQRDDDSHIPFFSGGSMPLLQILAALQEKRFAGYITLEIKPTSLQHIDAFIESYLYTLKVMNYSKYLRTKVRMVFLRPFLKKFIR